MVRILCFIAIAAIVAASSYFLTRGDGKKRNLFVSSGAVIAAAAGIFMQTVLPLHLSLLGILAISLIAAMGYAKVIEREKQKKQQMIEERRAKNNMGQSRPLEPIKKPVLEQAAGKQFGMQTISAVREEQEVG
ncbi:hypothetical protein [Planomicrobium sp. CPCC 101079]|uniref:hypothetical protein n=1 Tax=Planomicrobium sp. CPCC 101079 TaxID=2599618 RepID=UPI0011B7B4D8|nr:hypothetical protein [Planomicrobium sp. CPCC 101079]TWT09010.1 hypothetical protein FQV28_05070 [Planomicrobium sp. CPCC 101079]